MDDSPNSPDRAWQFLPFAVLMGFSGLIERAEAEDEARFADSWEEPSASAPFLRNADSRPWDLRLARILRHGQQYGEERDERGRQGGEQER